MSLPQESRGYRRGPSTEPSLSMPGSGGRPNTWAQIRPGRYTSRGGRRNSGSTIAKYGGDRPKSRRATTVSALRANARARIKLGRGYALGVETQQSHAADAKYDSRPPGGDRPMSTDRLGDLKPAAYLTRDRLPCFGAHLPSFSLKLRFLR